MIKRYTLENKLNFQYGDYVNVDMSFFNSGVSEIWRGKVIGLASQHVIDYWIVDFAEIITKISNYQYKAMTIPHVAILIPDKE